MQRLGYIKSRLDDRPAGRLPHSRPFDKGQSCDAELTNAKLTYMEYAIDSAGTGMEVHATHGPEQSPIERCLRDALHIFAPAGTSDIQALRS